MSRESLTFFVVTVVLCSVDAKQPELLKPTGNVSDSARFVPPPPPLFPAILFPVNAATGILVAIAIPVPLPDQSVFVSYNFEANYNMPNIPADSIPGPLIRVNKQISLGNSKVNTKFFSLNSTILTQRSIQLRTHLIMMLLRER